MKNTLSLDAIRDARHSRQLVASGPNNDAYIVWHDGKQLFVRERTVDHGNYLQTFAGERYVAGLFAGSEIVRIPKLHAVVLDEDGSERYAVFEVVDGRAPGWDSADEITVLATILARIHRVGGSGLGDIRAPLFDGSPATYLAAVFKDELSRVMPGSPMSDVTAELPGALDFSGPFVKEPICLCHGDVHGANFLRDQEGQLWTVDWEAAKYRVAAADFNQLHKGWLSAQRQDELLRIYAELTDRSITQLQVQVALLRLLWHVRTYNFLTSVKGMPFDDDSVRWHVPGVVGQLAGAQG